MYLRSLSFSFFIYKACLTRVPASEKSDQDYIKIHIGTGTSLELPGVKNPPSNAGDVGSILGRGTKIPHAAGQLSPRATTRERKKPCTPQLERSLSAATKTRHRDLPGGSVVKNPPANAGDTGLIPGPGRS